MGRRSISPNPATTPSPAILRSSMPNPCARCVAKTSSSTKEPSSSSVSMRSRAVALPAARRLLAASVSAWSAWYRRLRYWLIFCSETVVASRCGASTPSRLGVVRRTGESDRGFRAAIAHIVGAVPRAQPQLDLDRAVTLRQLRTFKTVADLNSFSLAAQRLKLSQPSVSYQVKELEETLGLPLLDRLGKRVQLTEAGSLLYSYARQMLDVLDDATVAIEEMRGIKRGTLRVGASTTVGIYLLPAALGAIKHAVESGLGLAVISRYACALEVSSGRLVELHVRGFPIRRDWHIVHLRKRKLPASVRAFIEFLQETSWLSRNGSRGRVRPPTD